MSIILKKLDEKNKFVAKGKTKKSLTKKRKTRDTTQLNKLSYASLLATKKKQVKKRRKEVIENK